MATGAGTPIVTDTATLRWLEGRLTGVTGSGSDGLDRAFAALIREHGPTIWRVIGSYEPNEHEREDLYQEIWLAIWRALPSFRGDAQLRTYLLRIAHNRGLTHRGRTRPRLAGLEEADAVVDPRGDTEQAGERQRELRAALDRLPAIHREAVVLRLEGLSSREIAAVLGITETNVGVRLLRARALLRQLLGDDR